MDILKDDRKYDGSPIASFHGTCMRGYYYSLLLGIHSSMLVAL
jgi:hypothetical protein